MEPIERFRFDYLNNPIPELKKSQAVKDSFEKVNFQRMIKNVINFFDHV